MYCAQFSLSEKVQQFPNLVQQTLLLDAVKLSSFILLSFANVMIHLFIFDMTVKLHAALSLYLCPFKTMNLVKSGERKNSLPV